MPTRHPPLTLAEHRALGAELKRIRDFLQHESVRLANTYGVSKKPGKLAGRATNIVDELRSEMEDQMERDAAQWPTADRAEIDMSLGEEQRLAGIRVYYPGETR